MTTSSALVFCHNSTSFVKSQQMTDTLHGKRVSYYTANPILSPAMKTTQAQLCLSASHCHSKYCHHCVGSRIFSISSTFHRLALWNKLKLNIKQSFPTEIELLVTGIQCLLINIDITKSLITVTSKIHHTSSMSSTSYPTMRDNHIYILCKYVINIIKNFQKLKNESTHHIKP